MCRFRWCSTNPRRSSAQLTKHTRPSGSRRFENEFAPPEPGIFDKLAPQVIASPAIRLERMQARSIPMSSTAATPVSEIFNYSGGSWRKSSATEFVHVTNPASGDLLAKTPLSPKADVDAVVQAAAEAFPAWRRTPAGERIQYLFKLKNLLEEHIDEISRLITLENGKTFAEAKAEWRRAIENGEVACGIPTMMQGYNLEDVTPGVDETLIRQPLGVVAAI